jgi:hypothetical protein
MSMPLLRELYLRSICFFASDGSHFLTGNNMDEECFMAIAEGLASLNVLEKLQLRGFCG